MLQETSTGARVATCVQRVTATRELRRITGRTKWQFDWKVPLKNVADVYCLRTLHDLEPQGLLALKIVHEEGYVAVEILEKAPHNFKPNEKYSGVGHHLMAIAAGISLAHGFGGYVQLFSKGKPQLIAYYEEAGFQRIGRSQMMYMWGHRASRLVRQNRSGRC